MRERGWKGEVQYQLVIISGSLVIGGERERVEGEVQYQLVIISGSLVIGGERERVEGGSTISIGNHFGVTGDRR